MYTRLLMSASATLLVGMGSILSFAPAETTERLEMSGGPPAIVTLQVMAGLFMGLGMINWMWRGNLIGGIYGRPIGVGNLVQFTVGALALGRALGQGGSTFVWGLFAAYLVFAVWFAFVVFGRAPARTAL